MSRYHIACDGLAILLMHYVEAKLEPIRTDDCSVDERVQTVLNTLRTETERKADCVDAVEGLVPVLRKDPCFVGLPEASDQLPAVVRDSGAAPNPTVYDSYFHEALRSSHSAIA